MNNQEIKTLARNVYDQMGGLPGVLATAVAGLVTAYFINKL